MTRQQILVTVTLSCALVAPLALTGVTLPNTFSNATVADANAVNANFGALKNAVDGTDARLTLVEERSNVQAYRAVHPGAFTFSNTGTAPFPDLSITFTPTSADNVVLVTFRDLLKLNSGTGCIARVVLLLDGATVDGEFFYSGRNHTSWDQATSHHTLVNLTPTEHTLSLGYNVSCGEWSFDSPAHFSVLVVNQ